MIDTLVVIATHGDGLSGEALERTRKWPTLVVRTGPEKVETSCWDIHYPHVLGQVNTPYRGYDTGAYLWAYWNVPAKNYLFLQDSCCPREDDFVEQFARAMPGPGGAVGWSSFTMTCWDSDAQRTATEWMYGSRDAWPQYGIFGPIFYTNRQSLDFMSERGLLPMPPVHKQQQQAMERAWAILFHRAGLRVNFLRDDEMPNGYAMERGEYPALNKTFRLRA